jgi:hypothetical protein
MVSGLGLPQMLEYFLRTSPGDVARKAGIARSRLAAALRLVRTSRTFHFSIGRDRDRAVDTFSRFVAGLR